MKANCEAAVGPVIPSESVSHSVHHHLCASPHPRETCVSHAFNRDVGSGTSQGTLQLACYCTSIQVSIGVTPGPSTTENRSRTPVTSFARKAVGSSWKLLG